MNWKFIDAVLCTIIVCLLRYIRRKYLQSLKLEADIKALRGGFFCSSVELSSATVKKAFNCKLNY